MALRTSEQAEIQDFDFDFFENESAKAKTAKIPYMTTYMVYRLGQDPFDFSGHLVRYFH